MPIHKPRSPSYSLKDLVLVTAFVEFVLSMTTAGLMRYHNGMANDIICVLGIALDARGSIVEWIDDRHQKERLHEKLHKRDALRATSSTRNTNSAQTSVTGPVNGVAARNGKDGNTKVDQGVIATNPLTTTNTSTPSSICIYSTSSSALGESDAASQTEEWRARSQNQESVLVTRRDGVESELAPTQTQENTKSSSVPLTTYVRSLTVPTSLDAPLPVEAKGMNQKPAAVHSTIEVEMSGDWSNSTLPMPGGTRSKTTAISNESQYNRQMEIRTITTENLLTTGAISLVLAASATLPGAPDASLSFQSDNSEAKPVLCPTTTEGDEAGIQESMEASQGGVDNVAVGRDCYEEATHLLTKTNRNETGDSLFPIATDTATNSSVLVRRYGERGTITHNDLLTGATSSIHAASSTLLGAPDSLLPFQADDLEMNQGMHPTPWSDGAETQEHRELTLGGDHVAVDQHKGLVVIHDSPLTIRNTDVTPPTASSRFPLMPDEVTEGKKKQEHTEVDPHIGSPEVPQTRKGSSKVN